MSPVAIAARVPIGIDFFGSFRSPLMAIPAVNPVTAGKKTANTTSRETELSLENMATVCGANSVVPKKMEINDIAMAAKIKNWALRAKEVLIIANTVKANRAIVPVIRKSSTVVPKPKYELKLSEKPIRYKAMEKAVPTYRAIPIDPPMGMPILLEST